ncbi:HTH-type transcriptional regulator HmrR [subsurface metagenome]
MNLSIGQLSEATGVKIPTIRYYEQIELLPRSTRDDGNRRRYGQSAVDQLRFIRHARDMGFEIEAIKKLISLASVPRSSCEEADRIALTHLADIRRRISGLQALERELTRMIRDCRHAEVADCQILSALADHGQCSSEHRLKLQENGGPGQDSRCDG